MKLKKYVNTLIKLCFSAVILGEAFIIFMMEEWRSGKISSMGVYATELPDIYISLLSAAAITTAGALTLHWVIKTYL